MNRGLRARLALSHALVAVLALVVMALVVFIADGRRFDRYVSDVQRDREGTVDTALADTYRAPYGWDASSIYALSRIAAASRVDVAVYSLRGQLLFTVQGLASGGGLGGGGGTEGAGGTGVSPSPTRAPLSEDEFRVRSIAVVADGKTVATAEIYAPRATRTEADSAFENGADRDLVIAALVAAALALVVSLLVSRRVTAPLEELVDVAGDVAGGNLDVRVAPRGDDEVGALATAFNDMADRLARDEQWRRDMTADLSQELRVPLAAIQSRLEELESGALPTTPDNLRPVGAEVERLGRLLGALRTLNELESEDLSVEHERIDLAEVGHGAVERAAAAFEAKGVRLESELSPAPVKGDRGRLLQVAASLLDNALKFTPAGGRVVLAVASGGGRPGAAAGPACLTVTDSGPGIDPVDLPFVFDRFYRGQGAHGTQGVGLGLAIARGLVEAQGGSIEAAAGAEGGAVVSVLLPPAS